MKNKGVPHHQNAFTPSTGGGSAPVGKNAPHDKYHAPVPAQNQAPTNPWQKHQGSSQTTPTSSSKGNVKPTNNGKSGKKVA